MVSLIAGGLAGTSVDVALFPIDTIKTRLQSPQGFLAAGGFRGIYNGLGAAAAGSAPGAALFFSVYEVSVWRERNRVSYMYVMGISFGWVLSCSLIFHLVLSVLGYETPNASFSETIRHRE